MSFKVTARDPDLVRLTLKGGEVLVVKVQSSEERDRLLAAAGVTAAERRLRMALPSAASQVPGGGFFGTIVLSALSAVFLFALGVFGVGAWRILDRLDAGAVIAVFIMGVFAGGLGAATYVCVRALRRREVVIGADGIAYRKTFGTEFIPYGKLTRILPDPRGVRLVRQDGRTVTIPTRTAFDPPIPLTPPTSPPVSRAEAEQRVLLDRIREVTATRAGNGLASAASLLDRNGRTAGAWRADLLRLTSATGDYRSVDLSPEDLLAVVENPAAPPERRVAAAVTLGANGGDGTRDRVRVAARACADEDMQAALEAAADGEIDEKRVNRAAGRQGG